MSFYNLRRGNNAAPQPPGAGQPETVDVIRKRAKHRLIGAAVLVLIGVVGFPLLFDAQPRPVAIDIPIEIPGKNTVKPLTMPGKPDAQAVQSGKPASQAIASKLEKAEKADKPSHTEKVTAAASLDKQEEIVVDKKAAADVKPAQTAIKKEAEKLAKAEIKSPAKAEAKAEAKTESQLATMPAPKAESKPAPKVDDGARAKALLDGKSASPSTVAAAATPAAASGDSEQRLVVQVGAFADADKAKEVRQKLKSRPKNLYPSRANQRRGAHPRASRPVRQQGRGRKGCRQNQVA